MFHAAIYSWIILMGSVMSIGSELPKGVNKVALDKLIQGAKASNSSAMLVYVDGRLVAETYGDGGQNPIVAMSASKSFANLAIGLLLMDGYLSSIDEPIYKIFPEWNQAGKRRITIRHILNHTSGLEPLRSAEDDQALFMEDMLKGALCANMISKAGERYTYNNRAIYVIGGIVKVKTGKRIDEYLQERLFKPIGINDATFLTDAFNLENKDSDDNWPSSTKLLDRNLSSLKNGNPDLAGGLVIRAKDLAKIGQLMLQDGKWMGAQLIPANFIKNSTSKSPLKHDYGLFWWVTYKDGDVAYTFGSGEIEKMRLADVDEAIIHYIEKNIKSSSSTLSIVKSLVSSNDVMTIIRKDIKAGDTDSDKVFAYFRNRRLDGCGARAVAMGDPIGFSAQGYLGQQLVVLPGKKIVGVRMIHAEKSTGTGVCDFESFSNLLDQISK